MDDITMQVYFLISTYKPTYMYCTYESTMDYFSHLLYNTCKEYFSLLADLAWNPEKELVHLLKYHHAALQERALNKHTTSG